MEEDELLLDELTARAVDFGAVDFRPDGNGDRVVLTCKSGGEFMIGLVAGHIRVWAPRGTAHGPDALWCEFELANPSCLDRFDDFVREVLR